MEGHEWTKVITCLVIIAIRGYITFDLLSIIATQISNTSHYIVTSEEVFVGAPSYMLTLIK